MNVAVRPDELLDGSCARLAIPPHHTPTLLETMGCDKFSVADQICGAVQGYIKGDIGEKDMWAVLSANKRI